MVITKVWLLQTSSETNTSDINKCIDSKITAASQEKRRQQCRTRFSFSAQFKKPVNQYFP